MLVGTDAISCTQHVDTMLNRSSLARVEAACCRARSSHDSCIDCSNLRVSSTLLNAGRPCCAADLGLTYCNTVDEVTTNEGDMV